jgi:hypothetical protein
MTDIAEMLQKIPPHRMEWRARLIDFLLPRLTGTAQEKELVLDMVFASLSEAHNEGIKDCSDFAGDLADKFTGDRQFVLRTIQKRLLQLHDLNAEGQGT